MGPGTFEGLLVILLAVIPGYIAVTLWARNKTWQEPPTDFKLLLLAVIVTGVIQLILFLPLTSWWIWPFRDELAKHPIRAATWGFVAVLLIPALAGLYAGRFTTLFWGTLGVPIPRTWKGWRRVLFSDLFPPVPPSPWDKFFLERKGDNEFLVITFKDGSKVGGLYWGPAWVATSPQVHGLFLAQEYTLDKTGHIDKEVRVSKGILIPDASNILSVKVMASAPLAEEEGK